MLRKDILQLLHHVPLIAIVIKSVP